MGIILSKFSRKKKSTFETLEELEKKIHKIEEYRNHTEQRHKKIVGNLILYSISLYVICALVFYFIFFPASLKDQLFCILPLLFFPILVVFIKKIVSWYYERKVLQNEDKITTMRDEKKEILNLVMEKETYKVAKEILEKFAPEQLRSQTKTSNIPAPFVKIGGTPGTELKHRAVGGQGQPGMCVNTLSLVPQKSPIRDPKSGIVVPTGNFGPTISGLPRASIPVPNTSQPATGQTMPPIHRIEHPKLIRPIIPRERGVMDRLVDYIMADGPSNRYALVCKECHSHNGMALKEEFEYLAFHCCFCSVWNPARKQRPHAPRLHQPYLSDSNLGPQTSSIASNQEEASSSSELESDSEDTNSKSDYSKKSPSEEKIVTQQPNQENSEANPIQEPEKMDVDIEQNSTSEKPSTLSE